MIVEGVICPICKDFLYPISTKKEFQFCKCHSIGIDHGIFIKNIFTYSKIAFLNKNIKWNFSQLETKKIKMSNSL
ncbi:MAG: hypothetical protein ACRDDH_08770 [Cetobacterium sp.]|uniref:hypothetical protein n=1 Tax=Cetobacterium sp. TaxID=2071632 RepID=UPI003EE4B6A1